MPHLELIESVAVCNLLNVLEHFLLKAVYSARCVLDKSAVERAMKIRSVHFLSQLLTRIKLWILVCPSPTRPYMFGQVAQKYQTDLLSFAFVCKYYHLEITSGTEPQSGMFKSQCWSLGLSVKETHLCFWCASEVAFGQGALCNIYLGHLR